MSDRPSLAAGALARSLPAGDAVCTLHTGTTATSAFTRSVAEAAEGATIDVTQPDGTVDTYRLGAPVPAAGGLAYSFPAEPVLRGEIGPET